MANIVFPTTAAIANTVPTNGNTVPITGLQALANHTEAFTYFSLCLENILLGDQINFGNSVAPAAQVNKVFSRSTGKLYLEHIVYTELVSNYAMFPDGKKMHKLVVDRLPTNPANSLFNF